MYDNIVELLKSIGYNTISESDDWLINFLMEKTLGYVIKNCNIETIPDELTPKIVEKICGDFLSYKKNSGQLTEEFQLNSGIKSIKEGDTQITYSTGEGTSTPEQRFNNLINSLTNNFERFVSRYRSLSW